MDSGDQAYLFYYDGGDSAWVSTVKKSGKQAYNFTPLNEDKARHANRINVAFLDDGTVANVRGQNCIPRTETTPMYEWLAAKSQAEVNALRCEKYPVWIEIPTALVI